LAAGLTACGADSFSPSSNERAEYVADNVADQRDHDQHRGSGDGRQLSNTVQVGDRLFVENHAQRGGGRQQLSRENASEESARKVPGTLTTRARATSDVPAGVAGRSTAGERRRSSRRTDNRRGECRRRSSCRARNRRTGSERRP